MQVEHEIVMMASPVFFRLGLVGYPLGHSLSPLLHMAGLAAYQAQGEYKLYPVPPSPAGLSELKDLLKEVRDGKMQGFNITIPYKQALLPYLDDLTPAAGAIGAVNTIYVSQGRLVGDNTDAPGFHSDLHARLSGVDKCNQALVLGAGGSARAVVHALLQDGKQITIAARRLAQAENLIDSLHKADTGLPSGEEFRSRVRSTPQTIGLSLEGVSSYLSQKAVQDGQPLLIVNTTPAGMVPDTSSSPWPKGLPIPTPAILYDLVYNPAETRLLRMARSQGIPAVNGLGMLIEQAALSFARWTGYPPPRQTMNAAILNKIEPNSSGVK